MRTNNLLWLWSVSSCYCATQDIITILREQAGLSTFIELLESSPNLINTLNEGAFTVFAPTDEAFAAFNASHPEDANSTEYKQFLLQYHIIKETYASAEFGLTPPLFPQSLLTSNKYVNVTGGQRIHLSLQNTQPTVVSGLKATSHVVKSDVFYRAGFIHIIDAVLTIPLSIANTVTGAQLTHLAALLNIGGWLSPDSTAKQILNDRSDLTVFAPNDPRYGATFTGFNNLSEASLNAIFQYSFAQEMAPLYSSALKDNTSYTSLAPGLRMLYTKVDNQSYVDSARMTEMDYLVSNGVLHITDAPLNPERSGIGPVLDTHTPVSSQGMSTGARAGLGIGIAAVVVILAFVITLALRRKLTPAWRPAIFGGKGQRLPEEETAWGSLKDSSKHNHRSFGMDKVELPDTAPPGYPIQELDSVQYPASRDRHAARPPHGKSASVVEILDRSETQTGNGARSIARTVDSDGRTVTITHELSDGSPVSPQEIDGNERRRSRLNISIEGDTPRHIGFQARY